MQEVDSKQTDLTNTVKKKKNPKPPRSTITIT